MPEIYVANGHTGYNMDKPGSHHYIGRPAPLGNPFAIGPDGTRAEVIEKYRNWLPAVLFSGHGEAIRRQLLRILADLKQGVVVLECYCAPNDCHGFVVEAMLKRWLRDDDAMAGLVPSVRDDSQLD